MMLRRVVGAVVGASAGCLGTYVFATWLRYGRPDVRRHPADDVLDRFLPDPEVDEYHRLRVSAPAEITYAVAREMDLMDSMIVRAIFWLRALPGMLRGAPFRPRGPRGLVAETLAMGWGVLAEEPGRKLVVGAYTQPWHEHVTFHALPAEDFAAFAEPGFVKIVWTIGAEPLALDRSLFVTRTRVASTDPEARRRFRLYWAPMSTGIVLIRYLSLPMVRREAERRARVAQDGAGPKSLPAGGRWVQPRTWEASHE